MRVFNSYMNQLIRTPAYLGATCTKEWTEKSLSWTDQRLNFKWPVLQGIPQGVVTYYNIPAVLTPATGIKVRSSGQAIKLETIKRSRCSFAPLKSRSRWVLSLTPPMPHPPHLAVRSSDQGPKMAPIKFWSRSRVSVQQVYMWPPLVPRSSNTPSLVEQLNSTTFHSWLALVFNNLN